MRKFKGSIRKLIGAAVAAGMVITAAAPVPVMADNERVVTIGADLSEERVNAILKYFGIQGKDVRTIYVTNQDEYDLLSSYISPAEIGTHALSCAYIQPTSKGGIHVKTANLTFVTSNMIASALSTSGVKNCNVIAACPIPVSGTGALTGVLKAYESSMGAALTDSRKQAAAQEIVTTGQLADTIGQAEATKIVNDIKIKIIENEVSADDEDMIHQIVEEVVADVLANTVVGEELESGTFSDDEMVSLDALAEVIAEQEYDYEDVRDTLELVDQNVQAQLGTLEDDMETYEDEEETVEADSVTAEAEAEVELAGDNILMGTDDTALGTDVVIDATDEEALADVITEDGEEFAFGEETGSEDPFEIVTENTDEFDEDGQAAGGGEFTEDGTDEFDGGTEDEFTGEVGDETAGADDAGVDETGAADETGVDEFGEVIDENGAGGEAGFDEFGEVIDENGTGDEAGFDEFGEVIDENGTGDEAGDAVDENGAVEFGEELAGADDGFEEAADETGADEFGEDAAEGDAAAEEEGAGEEAAAAVEATFAPQGDTPSFGAFSMKLYVNGDYVPASGTLSVKGSDGSEAASIDLSSSSAWAARSAGDAGVTVPGWDSANEIQIFTNGFGLWDDLFTVSGDITFASKEDGTETAPVHVESDFYYDVTGLKVVGDGGFKAGTTASVSVTLPEGAVSAEVYADESGAVRIEDGYADGETPVQVSLENKGAARITAEYLDENGEFVDEDTLTITVF